MIEARLYKKADKGYADCALCSFRCHIADSKFGVCGVRQNLGGTLYTHVYGRLVSRNIDPIEKKPLFHFQPGSLSYSIATAGCNFRCLHCQNSEISQMPRDHKMIAGEDASPEDVVSDALGSGSRSISYTYTEPTIFFEFAYDCAVLACKKGLKNVFVTNGYMTKECLSEMEGLLHGANVDIKSFREETYKKVCGARLGPVLESIERMRSMGVWVEATTLVIPTVNDSEEELGDIARWMAGTDPCMPWHISAFHPAYKMKDLPRTPVATIDRAREIGLAEGVKYVYTGNVPGDEGEDTSCPNCAALLVRRLGFSVLEMRVSRGACPECGFTIAGAWD